MSRIPTTLRRYLITPTILDVTRGLLSDAGALGFESAVLWTGHIVDSQTARIGAARRPEQIAQVTEHGLSVEITEDGLTALIASLAVGEVVLVRLHTHGDGDTRHSPLDDDNFVVAHEGAISVVVPYFAAGELDLAQCGVHELGQSKRWRRLSPREVAERFVIHV